jgi:Rrf2 family protein
LAKCIGEENMLGQTSVHVIKALIWLASQPSDKYVGAAAIASATEAPQNYLGKLLQQFCVAGLLESQRGVGGGVRLARPADRITLLDIVEPIEHLSQRRNCFMGQLCCGPQPCAYHARWLKLHSDYLSFLASVTLAGLAEQNTGSKPKNKKISVGRKK